MHMPSLEWTTRPRRMFYVRRRVIAGEIYLVHLTEIYRLNSFNDEVWFLCDGSRNLFEIASRMAAGNRLSHETAVESVCAALIFLQRARLVMTLDAGDRPALPPERTDWPLSPELSAIVAAAQGTVSNIQQTPEQLRPFTDRLFRLSYEAYFAQHGRSYGLSESAFRHYWEDWGRINPEKAAADWALQFKLRSLFIDADRGFCRVAYGAGIYEGFVGHRH